MGWMDEGVQRGRSAVTVSRKVAMMEAVNPLSVSTSRDKGLS